MPLEIPTTPRPHGLTYGMVKADFASVVANGVCADDARVLPAVNDAIRFLLQLPIIPVGCMATYDINATGTEITLPKQLENAIFVEVLTGHVNNQDDVKQGHYTLVSNFTYIDPNDAFDNPLDDMGLVRISDFDDPALARKYNYPGLTANATVRVTGKKRFIPITTDADELIVQNTLAIKSAILYREYLVRGSGSIDDANKYKADAISLIESELKQHLMDPRRVMKRKAAYQLDLITYAEGTLGRTRARLALELSGFLSRGKSDINYLINRAVQMLADSRNQLAITGRISVKGSIEELTYDPAVTPDTVLAWPGYNEIRLMVQGFAVESNDSQSVAVAQAYEKQAFELQRAKLIEETELARHKTYTGALSQYVENTFGWMVARCAVEIKSGLSYTTTEMERFVSMAERRIMERGLFKGTLTTLSATIHGGEILFPHDVEAMLASDISGQPCDLRSIFFEYQKNGPGKSNSVCSERFVDAGEVFFPNSGRRRRKYIFRGTSSQDVQFNAVCKLRWVQKEACDEMVIKNFEAIRLYVQSIIAERDGDAKAAAVWAADAIDVVEKETQQYLAGLQHVPNVDDESTGFAGLGMQL